MIYHFRVYKEDGGYWAECCELEGCRTQGNSMASVTRACEEALDLYLDEGDTLPPLPDVSLDAHPQILPVPVNAKRALALLLRHERHAQRLTQQQAATRLGMRNLYSYQRLEKRANPSLSLLERIHQSFPGIPMDRLFERPIKAASPFQ